VKHREAEEDSSVARKSRMSPFLSRGGDGNMLADKPLPPRESLVREGGRFYDSALESEDAG